MKRQGNEQPYTKIVEELPEMRGYIVVLAKKARGNNCRAYALVNNRSEGNAPLTIQALVPGLLQIPPLYRRGESIGL